MSSLFKIGLAVLAQLASFCSTTDVSTMSRDSRIKHQTGFKVSTSIEKPVTDASKDLYKSTKRDDLKRRSAYSNAAIRAGTLEVGKTGLASLTNFKPISLKRLLIMEGSQPCDYAIVDSTGLMKAICPEDPVSCEMYDSYCATCTQYACTTCNFGFTKSGNNCLCGTGMFINSGICDFCSSPCSTCSGSATTCTGCVPGYSLQAPTCVPTNVAGCTTHSSPGVCSTCGTDYQPTGGGSACSPCTPGTASAGGLCQACSTMCSTCSGSTANCVNCAAGYVFQINPRTCAAGCPVGQFVSGDSCAVCPAACSACTDGSGNSCSSCNTNYYLSAGTCATGCPPSMYANSANNRCESCHVSCATCSGTGDNQCLTCPGTYLTVAKYCKTGSCESNEYAEAGNICHSCDGSCATCNAGGSSGCTSCPSPNYLTNTKQCVSVCPTGTSQNDSTRTCDGCYAKCATCAVPNDAFQCSSCPPGRQLNAGFCRLSCNTNQYYITGTDDCGACNALCTSCTGPGITLGECICSGSSVKMPNGDCVASCPSTHFQDTNSNCIQCHSQCLTCNGQGNDKCTSCSVGFYKTLGGYCKTSCEIGEYVVSSNICAGCDGSCLSCRGTLGNCTECHTGSYLYVNPSNEGSCAGSCPSGYTPNATLKKCQACASQCSTCTIPEAPFSCIDCKANRTLRADKYCAKNCLSGEYFRDSDDTCNSCNILCSTCTGPATTECPTCSASAYRKLDGECVSVCPPATYADAARTCQLCNGNCLTCDGPASTNCLSCTSGLFRTVGHECKSSCDAHNYFDASNFCYLCHASCNTCENANSPNTCLSCYTGSWLNRASNSCGSTCPTSYMPVNATWTCETCAPTCATCTVVASPYSCSACGTGRWLRPDNYCQKTCTVSPPQYFLDANDSCYDCNTYCASCTNETSFCPTCTASAYRSLAGECLLTCPIGTYPDANRTCQLCYSTCQGCDGPLKNNCISCNSGKVLTVGKECKSTCDPHEWVDASSFCFACHNSCNTCNESSNSSCLSCYSNTWLNPQASTCGTTCPTSYMPVNATWTCETCAPTCATCTVVADAYKCSSCGSDRWLRPDKYCQKNCTVSPPQYFLDANDSCYNCSTYCASCTNGTSFCPTCTASAYRSLAGECLDICPLGTYPDSNRTCQLCNNLCQGCIGPLKNNCISCNTSLFLTVGKECKSTCDPHEWANTSSFCFACHNSCNTCASSSSSNSCLSCYNNTWFNPLASTCGATCPSSYMPVNVTWTCETCSNKCETCSAVLDPYKCTSCNTTYRFLRTDGYCQKNCTLTPPQYFVDANDSCVDCNSLCKSCTNGSTATNCTYCRDDAFRDYRGDCVAACPSDTYDAGNRTCQPCNTTCLTCSGPLGTNCLTCNPTLYLTASKACKASCDPHEWYNSSNFCRACDATCDTCSGSLSTECLTCNSTAYKFTTNSSCQTPCPNGFMDNNLTRECGVCHANCKKCSEERNAYKCMSCFSDRKLRTDGYCIIPCRDGQYFDDNSDSCQPCHPYCATCGGGGLSDCINCAQGLFLSYTTLCAKSCPTDSYANGTTCVRCHRSCSTCSGPTAMNCLTCPVPQVLTVAKACSDTCDQAEVANSERVCEKCHPTCSSCKSPSMDGCLACQNPDVTTLSAAGNCLNCLINPEVDPETCWYSVPLSLSKASTRGLSLQASTTIRLSFRNESLFQPRITSELLKQVLVFDVPGLSAAEWVWLFRQTGGEMLIDLYFMESKEGDFKLVAKPKEQIILRNSANIAQLIFWNKTAEYKITVRKAPDAGMVEALTLASSRANSAGAVMGTVSSIMSVVAIASASGLGAPLLKILRIFKLLSRLRLINVFFGSYLEVFLQAVGRLYALGGDDINLEVAKLTPKSRGKLDMYKVSVLSADVMALKYAVYFLSLTVRVYRAKIRGYALQRGSLSVVDAILDSIGERCKTMLLVMVGIDIVFYSLRCVSHMDVMGQLDFIASCSFLLSMITIIVFVLEFYMLIEFNIDTTFTALRRKARMARVVVKRAAALKEGSKNPASKESRPKKDNSQADDSIDGMVSLSQLPPSAGKVMPKGKKLLQSRVSIISKRRKTVTKTQVVDLKNAKKTTNKIGGVGSGLDKNIEHSTLGSWKGSGEKTKRSKLADSKMFPKGDDNEEQPLDNEENNEKLSEYLYGYRQQKRVIDNPSAEQFFGNGIKLHKLRTPEGRYYNTVALVKMFALEPLFINLQMFSTAQIIAIYLVQLAFVVWTVRAGMMKRVFSSVIVFTALAINEIAVLVFLTVGVFFQLAGGERSVSSSTSSMVQFVAIGAIAVACVVGFLEFFVSIILAVIKGIQDRKVAVAQKAVNNHRDEMKSVRHRVIGRDLPGAEPPVPPVDADMSSSVADIKANQVGQSAKPVLGKTRLAPGKRLSRPPLQPLARK